MNIKRLLVFNLFIIFFFNFSLSQTTKNYQSLLWEIKGNGLTKPSYLYGTMHVSDKLAFNLPDSFFIAIKNCNAVALELDMGLWMDDIMLMQEVGKIKNTAPYSNTNSFYRRAFSVDVPEKDNLKSILQFKPNIVNRLMYRNSKQNSDYEEDNYLDVFIYQAGRKLGKQIVGLEVFKTTEELSKKSEKDENEDLDEKVKEEIQEQKRLRKKELLGDKSFNDVFEDSYRNGDLDLLISLFKLTSTDGYLKYMLYERNEIMAKKMDSVMRKGPLFTGVGAAHLPGDEGVIELLRKMGYTVRSVNTGKADIKSKTQLDETRFPTKFANQYAPDSVFSVSIPGKLYQFEDEGSFRYYLYNDMSNGSYYCIQRMNHYGNLMNQSQEYILKRLDSLIFENIPGKLLSKKEIKNASGFPGVEILNKTGKGDYQKHQIFITPNEIISFKMSGSQEYVNKGTETDAFFSSIVFYEPRKSKFDYQSKYGYSITIPGNKSITEMSPESNRMQHEIISATSKTNNDFALVMASSLYDFDYIEEDTFELNMLAERFCLETNKKIISKTNFNKNGNPALWVKMETQNKPGQTYFAQIIINGPDYYLLCTNYDSLGSASFFNSFKITAKTYITPFKTITDTSLYFSASAHEITNTYSALMNDDDEEKPTSKKAKEEKLNKEFLPIRKTKIYTSPETKEKILVEYRKFSRYFQHETMDAFWKSRIDPIGTNQDMKVSRRVTTKKGNTTEYTLLLTDTGSTRGIVVKFIQRCGALYTLKAVVDTTKEMSGFVKTFYDSFLPKDTCIGIDVTSDKLDTYFFGKLYSTDTTESRRAKAAIEFVQGNMLKANLPMLISTLNKKEFKTLPTNVKREMIASLEAVKSKETVPFLQNLYVQYSDSLEIELAILKTLARLETEEATNMFLKLLKVDVPITANEYNISNLFTNFADSLQNAALLFPEILKYTKYPEYKNSIYKLMAQICEAQYLKPKKYSKLVNDIVLDANYEVKKYISEKDKDRESYRGNSSNQKMDRVYDDLNSRQQKIYNFMVVLSPFYKNSDVSKFFNKVLASTNNFKFKSVIYGQLLASNLEVHDTIIKKYALSPQGRIMFYKVLKTNNKLGMLDKNYLSQKDLVISQLYGSNENFRKDTIVLLALNKVVFNNKPGNVYIFKTRPKDKKIWKLGYSAVHPANEDEINNKPFYTKTSFSFDSEKQAQKEIDMLLRKIRVEYRKRGTINDFDKDSGRDYDY